MPFEIPTSQIEINETLVFSSLVFCLVMNYESGKREHRLLAAESL